MLQKIVLSGKICFECCISTQNTLRVYNKTPSNICIYKFLTISSFFVICHLSDDGFWNPVDYHKYIPILVVIEFIRFSCHNGFVLE